MSITKHLGKDERPALSAEVEVFAFLSISLSFAVKKPCMKELRFLQWVSAGYWSKDMPDLGQGRHKMCFNCCSFHSCKGLSFFLLKLKHAIYVLQMSYQRLLCIGTGLSGILVVDPPDIQFSWVKVWSTNFARYQNVNFQHFTLEEPEAFASWKAWRIHLSVLWKHDIVAISSKKRSNSSLNTLDLLYMLRDSLLWKKC